MSDFENREEKDQEMNVRSEDPEGTKDAPAETGTEKGTETPGKADGTGEQKDGGESKYEDVCFICRRPESKAGKMYHLPNNICVCEDCMHRTMDTVSQFDYQGLLNNPQLMNMLNNMNRDGKYPSISFVNLSDLQGTGGIPNKQKIKRKAKEKEKAQEPVFNIGLT